MQILQGISAGENLRGDDTAEHLDGADSAEISTADDVFVTASLQHSYFLEDFHQELHQPFVSGQHHVWFELHRTRFVKTFRSLLDHYKRLQDFAMCFDSLEIQAI